MCKKCKLKNNLPLCFMVIGIFSWQLFNCQYSMADDFDFDLVSEDNDISNISSNTSSDWEYSFTNILEAHFKKFTHKSGFLNSKLRLDSSFKVSNSWFTGFGEFFADYDEAIVDYDKRYSLIPYEIYVSFQAFDNTSITLGKNRLSWGMNDGRSTGNFINATYMKDPMANGRTVQKWPAWMIKLEQSTSFGKLETVFLPIGKDRKTPNYDSPWELPALHTLREADKNNIIEFSEKTNPHKPEWGVRYMKYASGFDLGGGFYSGFSDLPVIKQIGDRSVVYTPIRQQSFIITSAMTTGNSTLRTELSYTRKSPVYNDSGVLYFSDEQQLIVGWDRNFDWDIYANVQLFSDRFNDYSNEYGSTISVNQKYFNESLILGANGMLATHGAHTMEMFGEYSLNDQIKINLRYFAIGGGRANSMYKAYDKNDYLEIGFKYYF